MTPPISLYVGFALQGPIHGSKNTIVHTQIAITASEIIMWIGAQFTNLDEILIKLEKRILQRMDKMAVDLSRIQSDVSAEKTVIDSVVALLTKLSAEIADLKSQLSAPDAKAQAAIDALAAAVEANAKTIADAVAANTPAA